MAHINNICGTVNPCNIKTFYFFHFFTFEQYNKNISKILFWRWGAKDSQSPTIILDTSRAILYPMKTFVVHPRVTKIFMRPICPFGRVINVINGIEILAQALISLLLQFDPNIWDIVKLITTLPQITLKYSAMRLGFFFKI